MSLEEKIQQAKPSDWLADGIPKWKVKLIILTAKLKARLYMKVKGTKMGTQMILASIILFSITMGILLIDILCDVIRKKRK